MTAIDHFCETPVNKAAFSFGDTWECPECKKRWTLTIDESDDPCAYWDSDI